MGRMTLQSESYRQLTTRLKNFASDCCGGRLVMVHEGGYSEAYKPFAGHAVLETLADVETEVHEPFHAIASRIDSDELRHHQRVAVDRAGENLDVALTR